MPYGLKYRINWQARFGDMMHFDILEKDYVGTAGELTGDADVCNLDYESGDGEVATEYKVSKAVVRYLNEGGVSLFSFYSEDDEFYKGELHSARLLWSGFLVQDDCSEEFADLPYVVELVFTDNLGLLKDITFDEACADKIIDYVNTQGTYNAASKTVTIDGILVNPVPAYDDTIYLNNVPYKVLSHTFSTTLQITLIVGPAVNGLYDVRFPKRDEDNLLGKHTLWSYIRLAIQNCTLPMPVRCFNNLYEDSHDEALNMFDQTRQYSGKYISEDGTWESIYDIVFDILFRFKATLVQADGYWNIIRWGEAYRFADNEIEGHEYDENFEDESAVTLLPEFDVISTGTDNELIGADAITRIIRPLKMVKETFNYVQPRELVRGIDLKTTGPLFDSEVLIESGISYRYDYYHINNTWRHEDSAPNGTTLDTSYIVVKTQLTGTATEVEVDRYLYMPNVSNDDFTWLQLTPIEVSQGDTFDFSYSIKAVSHTADTVLRTSARFTLFLPGGGNFVLTKVSVGGVVHFQWNGTNPDAFYKTGIGFHHENENDTEFEDFSLSEMLTEGQVLRPFPADGVLVIGMSGSTNSLNNGDLSKADAIVKNLKLEFFNSINDTTNVIGHTHTDTYGTAKNVFDEEIPIDDSPRNVIAGTLFTNDPQQFQSNIGLIYFTKTEYWGFKGEDKLQRLGQFLTNEQHAIRRKPRSVKDCAFVFHAPILTPLNVIFMNSVPGLSFIFGVCGFDYMNMIMDGTIIEIHEDDEVLLTTDYEFEYLYENK